MMRRRIFIAIGILLPVALTAVIVLTLPAERIGAFVAARAEGALHRPVRVERFNIRLLPRPAVTLENVEISGPVGSVDSLTPLATAQRIELRPRLLPLLAHNVVIDQIVLESPRFVIHIDSSGTSNLPTFADTAKNKSGDAELNIRRLRIEDGGFVYRDARNNTVVRLAGIDQILKLSTSLTAGELARVALAGKLSIDDIDADLPGKVAWPVRDLAVSIAHDARLDRRADRLELKQLELTVQEIALELAGIVTGVSDSLTRVIELRAHTGSFDVAKLIASLPKSLWAGQSGDALSGAAGRAQLDALVTGRAGKGVRPRVNGTLHLEDVALARGKHGRIAEGVNGTIAFSLDSVTSSAITGRVLGEPLRVAFNVHNLAAPAGSVKLQAFVALAQAQKLGLLPEGSRGRGRVAIDVQATGSVLEPANALLEGQIGLSGVELQSAALKQPVLVKQGRVELRGRHAAGREVRATIGNSDVAFDFNAQEFLPFALGDTLRPPTIQFEARSANFDMDEIFGVKSKRYTYGQLFFARLADRPLDGESAEHWAAEAGLGMPEVPGMIMDGRLRAAKLVRGGMSFDSVDVTVAARNRQLDVRAARFRMMGGGVHLTGRLGLATRGAADSVRQPLALEYSVSEVTAQQFLQRFTSFRDHITGQMLLAGSASMNLDRHLLPERQSVNGSGTMAVLDGEIVNWPLLRALGERIGRSSFDTLAFQDWSGRYRMVGPKVLLEESSMQSGELAVRAAGNFDVNGTLDLGATVYMPKEWAAHVPGAPAAFLTNAVAEADGRVPVGAHIAGTARQPTVALDLSQAGTRAAHAARQAAQNKAKEAAAGALDKLTDKLLPRDSAATATDSAQKKVETEVKNRLKKLFGSGN